MTGVVSALGDTVQGIFESILGIFRALISAIENVVKTAGNLVADAGSLVTGAVDLFFRHIILIGAVLVGLIAFSAYQQRRGRDTVSLKKTS